MSLPRYRALNLGGLLARGAFECGMGGEVSPGWVSYDLERLLVMDMGNLSLVSHPSQDGNLQAGVGACPLGPDRFHAFTCFHRAISRGRVYNPVLETYLDPRSPAHVPLCVTSRRSPPHSSGFVWFRPFVVRRINHKPSIRGV